MNQIELNHSVGVIGLGKMGNGVALHLNEKGWNVHVFNRSRDKTENIVKSGGKGFYTLEELVNSLPKPRIIWVMVTAGEPTEEILFGLNGLINYLEADDIVIDGANSFFKDSIRRAKILEQKGIRLIDAGVSGGPSGARKGACIMVGGNQETFKFLEPIFRDLSVENGYRYLGESGAGHFVKMVHNGIEYGMMQSIAEGFNLMKESEFKLNLVEVADLYNHKSVIESRLISWLKDGFEKYGEDLSDISGSVGQLGEGRWTVNTAEEMKVQVPVITESLKFRDESIKNPSYTGKILSMLRNMFGGHDASSK